MSTTRTERLLRATPARVRSALQGADNEAGWAMALDKLATLVERGD